jgi:hypothetical protein
MMMMKKKQINKQTTNLEWRRERERKQGCKELGFTFQLENNLSCFT